MTDSPSPAPGRPLAAGLGWIRSRISNAFVLREGSQVYLIDSGWSERAGVIRSRFAQAGVPVENVTHILLTHQHPDHMGGAAYLRWMAEAQVICHRLDAGAVEGTAPRVGPWIGRALLRSHPVKVDRKVEDGDTIGPFTVIHLPGHTPGSVAYYHKERRILFSGDAVVTRPGGVALASKFATYDPERAIDSLQKLARLDIAVLLSGHGPPLTQDVSRGLTRLVERYSHLEPPRLWTLAGPEGLPETHPKG
jgi:glyoxylase-like metal-dependent hydrolase (beta-lactamase superfamily II)